MLNGVGKHKMNYCVWYESLKVLAVREQHLKKYSDGDVAFGEGRGVILEFY